MTQGLYTYNNHPKAYTIMLKADLYIYISILEGSMSWSWESLLVSLDDDPLTAVLV